MRRYLFCILYLFLAAYATAQGDSTVINLVYNPSFEDYTECPKKIEAKGVLTVVEGWYQPTSGSADYYNRCSKRECGVPINKLGYQEPRTGDGYCGIYCSKNEYREYLQTQLRQPLESGRKYMVTIHVSLCENSNSAVSTIGALFTQDRISDTSKGILMQKKGQQINSLVRQTVATYYVPQVTSTTQLNDTSQWMEVKGTFTANGGERFMTIGNFFEMERSEVREYEYLTELLSGSYYYIDDVSVVPVGWDTTRVSKKHESQEYVESPILDVKTVETPEVGSTIVLHDIYFQYDKSVILQQSYNELASLLDLMQANQKMRIEIGGHTDDQGSVSYNQRLSENRAKAVADYLINKGINPKRIVYRGYGKSKPLDDNKTEESRAKNRRVEVKILSR